MSCPFNDEQLAQLKAFTDLCKSQPMVLHHPKLAFFKEYLLSLGVNLPTATFGSKTFTPSSGDSAGNNNAEEPTVQSSGEESDIESDVELDMEGIIQADPLDPDQVMGDPAKVPTEEECDQSDEKRVLAMKAFNEQQFDNAIKLYSEAIQLNPQSALFFAKRGQVYLKMKKPNACIKDCSRALELNCDSAQAYKFRGWAYRLLGKFEESSHDLCESLKIDYDDQTNEWLSEVKPNAEKLRQHKLSLQRKKEEREHREKIRRARKAQEARAKAAQAQAEAGAESQEAEPSLDFSNLLFDPEIMAAFQDPEVAKAFQDVSANPSNFVKYQNNPKISAIIEKLQRKLGKGGAGFPGAGAGFPGAGAGFPGAGAGFPGAGGAEFPGAGAGFPGFGGAEPKPSDDDVGLD